LFHESSSPKLLKGHFATGINDTGSKFATDTAGAVDTGGYTNGNIIRLITPSSELAEKTRRKKFIFMLTLLPKGVKTKFLKLFLLSCEYIHEFSKNSKRP
jgi:hypothetical protein